MEGSQREGGSRLCHAHRHHIPNMGRTHRTRIQAPQRTASRESER